MSDYYVRASMPVEAVASAADIASEAASLYVVPATSRNLTVSGALRLLFPSLASPSKGGPIGGPLQ